ncbi:MAG TPA: CRISPR system precrRNA processing endoribonuclease RAMP protein Cas6 [Roseiflexaceae bacterium]|nr:CRISPR system precrRNA processing endoribonuclease RAMP protein Cas6 [Roseiflexaceae bacterium]
MLTTHHLAFTATAITPLELEDQAGSSIRGAVVGGLWERFCANQAAPTCADCALLRVCPVAALIAPMREDGEKGGQQRPRPYVVQPPQGAPRYAPAQSFDFGLALFGHPAQLFPYVVMAAQALEQSGLGRRLPENGGRRGALRIERIAAVDPLSGARQPLFERGRSQVQAPGLPLDGPDVAAYAATLPGDRLTLHFRTPLRLIDDRQLVKRFAVRPFIQRLMRRLDDLCIAYGDGPLAIDFHALLDAAARVQVVDDRTRWVDVVSYSARSRQRTPIGGLVGRATLAGELGALRELLVWGSLIHVGKNAVKGDGWYQIVGVGG